MGWYRVKKKIDYTSNARYQAEYRPLLWPFWFGIGSEKDNENDAWARAKNHKENNNNQESCWPCIFGGSAMFCVAIFVVFIPDGPRLGISIDQNCRINEVMRGSDASRSGLRIGDKFVEIDGQTDCDFKTVRGAKKAVIERNGKEISLTLDRR